MHPLFVLGSGQSRENEKQGNKREQLRDTKIDKENYNQCQC